MSFNIGDVVELRSGGPAMTVTSILDGGSLNCSWFAAMNADEVSSAVFTPAALIRVQEAD